MSKTKISEFSTTPGNNTDINGINIAEGCAPSGINNAIRELMSDLKEWQSGAMDVYVIPQGTAAAPGIQLYGDLDTGLYGYAANQLGVAVGGASAGYFSSAGWVGNVNGTITGDINATTIDTTNLEVTNIKAKDGTAAITIADSTGVVSVSTQLAVDNLNLSGNTLSSSDTNGNIILAPNGTGDVYLDADTIRVGDSNANAIITTNGTGDLTLNTNSGTNSGAITIEDGANGNINIVPNGTGGVYLDNTAGTSLFVRNTTSSASGSSFAAFQNKDGAGNYRTVARASGLTTSNGGNGSFVVETAFSNVLYKGLLINSESDVFFYDSNGNQALKWDSSDKYLGINQTSPTAALDVVGDVKVSGTVNAATIDLTNIEVSNIKAKDGTAAITIADSTGAVGISTAVTMSATTQNIALGTSQTTGTFTVGGAAQTGTQTFDQSTKTHTLNLGTGATESGLTKTINLGTAGVSGSTTTITVGSANGTTTTLNGTVTAATLNSTTIDTTNIEVTNIKAKDGTAALSIADSTGVVSVSANPVLSGGTANGVVYLNASKSATSGTALTFDGTKLGVGVASAQAGVDIANSGLWSSGNIYNYPAGNAFVKIQGVAAQNNWIGIAGSYGQTTGSANLLLQANFNNTTQQAGHYIGSEAQSATSSDLTFGSITGGVTTGTNATKNEQMRLDSSGNLGLRVTPSAWASSYRAAQVGDQSALVGFNGNFTWLGTNWVSSAGGDNYIANGYATIYRQNDGAHAWYTAPSGTAGNAITFTQAMTLDASGNLGIGTSSVFGKLSLQNSTVRLEFGETSGANYLESLNNARNATAGFRIYGSEFKVFTGPSGSYGDRLTVDSSGNLGLGVTPSAWKSEFKVLQLNARTSLFGSADSTFLSTNEYIDSAGTSRYIQTGSATRYRQDDRSHIWSYAASGTAGNAITFTQAMTLDVSGRLGIGVTNPSVGLVVAYGTDGIIGNYYSSSGNNSRISFSNLSLLNNNVSIGSASDALVMYTNNTECARITSGGYFKASNNGTYKSSTGTFHELRVNTANDVVVVIGNSSATNPYGASIEFSGASPDNNTQYFLKCIDSTTDRCFIYSDGDLANHDGVYGTISDQKLKQDIVDAGSQWDDIKAIRFRKYRMKSDVAANPDAPALLGVIAQELEQVSPGLVDEHPDMETVEVTDEDGNVTQTQQPTGTTTKTVKSSILLMKAAVALQEAMARIEKLEAEVAALKGV